MALFFAAANRTVRSSLLRQYFTYQTTRALSVDTSNDFQQTAGSGPKTPPRRRRYGFYFLSIGIGALVGTLYTFRQSQKYEGLMPEYLSNIEILERKALEARPVPPPVTKHVTFKDAPREDFPFKVTLYQYVTCPFCCKVRAYLNYNRIPYDIVEVNSVMRSETKWSIYKKVPIVVIEDEEIQLNDSSMIISAIESFLRMPTRTFRNVARLYQPVIERDSKGKLTFNYPNKYFLVEPLLNDRLDPTRQVQTEKSKKDAADTEGTDVPAKPSPAPKSFLTKFFGRSNVETEKNMATVGSGTVGHHEPPKSEYKKSSEQYKLERKWREWVDTKFVHTLSPNVYCTLRQSLNTFRWFSQAGDWEQIFPWYQRWIIVYVGAVVMRVVAERLKTKHKLNSNVRLSLYECANEWVKAVGKKDFLGGSEPNLADLNVYGILTSIQGCEAFQDLMTHTKIQPWFERMKHRIEPQ